MKRANQGNDVHVIHVNCEESKICRTDLSFHPTPTNSEVKSNSDTAKCGNIKDTINHCVSGNLTIRTNLKKLGFSFFDVPCEYLARSLIGKILVRSFENGTILRGRIVETECYLGGDDKASHSYNGKITPRNRPMYMNPGTTYVYFTYGMYFCFNISSKGDGAAVLVRAVEPLEGHEYMTFRRMKRRMDTKKYKNLTTVNAKTAALKLHDLCNGPGKLCISFNIDDKSCNMRDLCTWEGMWIEADNESDNVKFDDLITSSRIGLNSVDEEWALKPLRFYLYGNRSVSKKDKKRELEKMLLFNA